MSLRVKAPLGEGDIRRGRGEVAEDPYMNRLVKLVPAEAVGPYPFLMSSAANLPQIDGSGARWGVYFVAWTLLLIVIIVRWNSTSEPGKGAQWGAVLIAAVAFVIWVHVMGGDFGLELLFKQAPVIGADGITRGPEAITAGGDTSPLKQFVANVSLMAWTTLAPVVYKGEDAHA